MPTFENKRIQKAQLLMDSVIAEGVDGDSGLQLDSVMEIGEKMSAFDEKTGNKIIRQTVLDAVNHYKKYHGTMPSADKLAIAVDHANVLLDDAIESGSSIAQAERAFVPRSAMVAIRSTLAGAVPFGYYLATDKQSGEAPLIIVSHKAGANTGMYDNGHSLDGLGGGNPYITSDRVHKLTSTDRTTYSGKITATMTSFEECDQNGQVAPLYAGRTQIMINGLLAATTTKTGEQEQAVGSVKLDKTYTFTATVNIKTGVVSVVFNQPMPENTVVHSRGYINFEELTAERKLDLTPSIITTAEKFTMYAKNYRAKVIATPEAMVQFKNEIGIDPAFEGTMSIRQQFAQEMMYKTLQEACIIAKFQNPVQFDFNWKSQGLEKSQAQIAQELLGQISKVSQTMANKNGSHGVSHIYVDDTLRAIFLSLSRDYFEPAQIPARAGVYRLGRLVGLYEVYYAPKGLMKSESVGTSRMLLIGANANQPAFNPFIFGEAAAPNVKPISANSDSPNEGYWVTGKNFAQQNPVATYASSVALIDVINTAY